MDLLTLWPWPFNPQTKVIPYTKFEHFGVILFWVMLRTNKQTDDTERPTNVGVSN